MASSPILFLLILAFWVLGIGIVWFFIFSKDSFVLDKSKILLHFLFSFLAFLITGAIMRTIGFVLVPDEIKNCIGPICKIEKINRIEFSQNFGVIMGLLAELATSLRFSLKFFVKPLTNFDSEPE